MLDLAILLWLRRLLGNVVANTHRYFGRDRRNVRFELQLNSELDKSSIGLAQLASGVSSPSERAIRREQAVLLSEALQRLPENYRQVLISRELEGRSLAEIAGELGCTRNAVQKLWARAIRELRQNLSDTAAET